MPPNSTEQALGFLAHYNFQGMFDGGRAAKILCPVHREDTPSMYVYLGEASAHCYGCGWHGTLTALVQEIEKCSMLGAMILLRKWANDPKVKLVAPTVSAHMQAPKPAINPRKSWLTTLPLLAGSESKAEYYMNGRGFEDATLRHFDIRYRYGDEWPVVVPILSNGEVIAWQSRRVDKVDTKKKPKYVFQAGSKPYNVLAGNTEADTVLITEGYFDHMKAFQHLQKMNGFAKKTAVCTPLSWVLRERQANMIKARWVVIALDNDERGWEGTEKAFDLLPNAVSFKWDCGYKDVGEMSFPVFKREFMEALKRCQQK
jgi:DNA primase